MSSPLVFTAALRIDLAVNNNVGGSPDRTLIQDPAATSNAASPGVVTNITLVAGVPYAIYSDLPGLQTAVLIPQPNSGVTVKLLVSFSDTGILVDANTPIVIGALSTTTLYLLSPTAITYQLVLI
jgi:hypothetical protein